MVKIKLTKKRESIVDDDMGFLSTYKWFFNGNGYAGRRFKSFDGTQKTLYLHHCVIGFPLNGLVTDHINNNTLDNRRSNLRTVTERINQSNQLRKKIGKATSKYPGVSWNKSVRKWMSQIRIKGHTNFLGHFSNEIDAANSYQNALREVVKC
jgi:hypothetical protein